MRFVRRRFFVRAAAAAAYYLLIAMVAQLRRNKDDVTAFDAAHELKRIEGRLESRLRRDDAVRRSCSETKRDKQPYRTPQRAVDDSAG